MKIVKLTKETKNDLLESLLKRSPNNYGQYESVVNEIIENVKANRNQALFDYDGNALPTLEYIKNFSKDM